MMHWIVIPFRGPENAKTRLQPALSDNARATLARAMFQHVLNVATRVVGGRHVLVATPSPVAARLARKVSAMVIRDTSPGLNEALSGARAHLRTRGASTMTIVGADLPLVEPSDIERLMYLASHGHVGMARAWKSGGTNGLSLPVSLKCEFQFGDDSFDRHWHQILELGTPPRECGAIRLRLDVDDPEDLAFLRKPGALSTLPSMPRMAYRGH
jgi:2-phospho-L-lactate guanylyltransferase